MRPDFAALAALAALTTLTGCPRSSPSGSNRTGEADGAGAAAAVTAPAESAARSPAGGTIELDVDFSSEKKDWAAEAFEQFNGSDAHVADGRRIHVRATFGGSVEPIDGIVAGTTRPHVFSPASSLVLPLLQDRWTAAHGAISQSGAPIAGAADPMVLSPVVIAMWEPMARALGWPAKKLGWSDVAALARSTDGWRGKGHAEWGDFRFGHTHPGYSNSGLISVLAETYAGAGKTRDLQPSDVTGARAKAFVGDVESAVVHYGRSTGFFYDDLAHYGPSYLSAAVMYENLVVPSSKDDRLPFPLVCIYPKEGTQWADHPYAILDAPWVGAPEREAATKLKAFLMSRDVQQRAMTRYGFRPGLVDIAVDAPIDAAHGANPKEPQTLLGTPSVRTIQAVIDAWKEVKRGVDVVIVFDRSGSMGGARLRGAREGLLAFLGTLKPTDRAVLMTFSGQLDPPSPAVAPAELASRVEGIFAGGDTALYDAVLRGRNLAEESAKADRRRIHAEVVLTDGEDTSSQTKLPDLMAKLTPAEQGGGVRIFTIGYGKEASEKILKDIAVRTGGAYYHGDVDNIRAVYDEIGSFF